MTSIADIRTEYARASLDIADVDANPLRQFRRWFDEALKAEVAEVNAMSLATVDALDLEHSVRIFVVVHAMLSPAHAGDERVIELIRFFVLCIAL